MPKVNAGNGLPLLAAVLILVTTLSACSSTLSELPQRMGGLPEGTPARPAEQPAYPAVHDMPPARPSPVLNDADRKKAEADLAAARDNQAKRIEAAAKEEQ